MFCVFAAFYADKILFPFPSPPTCREDQVDFYLTTRSGIKVACAQRIPAKGNGLVVLYSHGNGEDIGNLMPLLDEVSEKGIQIIAYDYPGYGLSQGKPSEAGCYEAIDAAYRYLTQDLGVEPHRIVAWGRSLGTGPSCYLASTSSRRSFVGNAVSQRLPDGHRDPRPSLGPFREPRENSRHYLSILGHSWKTRRSDTIQTRSKNSQRIARAQVFPRNTYGFSQ